MIKSTTVENDKRFESVYSSKVRAGRRRTYFFDVKKTKGEDFYITLTESTKKFTGDGYERHKIFLYKEDFNRFAKSLNETIDYVKTELMPDYDYEQFERRQAEWEAQKAKEAEEAAANGGEPTTESTVTEESAEAPSAEEAPSTEAEDSSGSAAESEDDLSW